jgi:hypothetical protein
VKRILKHINGTSDYDILYSDSENSKLIGYCDTDYTGSADDREGTPGGLFNTLFSCWHILWLKRGRKMVWLYACNLYICYSACMACIYVSDCLSVMPVFSGVFCNYFRQMVSRCCH